MKVLAVVQSVLLVVLVAAVAFIGWQLYYLELHYTINMEGVLPNNDCCCPAQSNLLPVLPTAIAPTVATPMVNTPVVGTPVAPTIQPTEDEPDDTPVPACLDENTHEEVQVIDWRVDPSNPNQEVRVTIYRVMEGEDIVCSSHRETEYRPIGEPTVEPTVAPTEEPTQEPTLEPTEEPEPTDEPDYEDKCHGNHYGNDVPDCNEQDESNPHDGEDSYDDHHGHH